MSRRRHRRGRPVLRSASRVGAVGSRTRRTRPERSVGGGRNESGERHAATARPTRPRRCVRNRHRRPVADDSDPDDNDPTLAPAPAPTDVSLTFAGSGCRHARHAVDRRRRVRVVARPRISTPRLRPYTRVFDERRDSLIHEFSFLASADGNYEQGHIAMLAISGASTEAVSRELAAVLRSSFASCAAGTAVNWFNDHGEGTIASVSPCVVSLPVGGSAVIWRGDDHRPSRRTGRRSRSSWTSRTSRAAPPS